MADRRGTDWREDAKKLEALNRERIDNPGKTFPNYLTSIDKAHAHRAKSDEGRVDQEAHGVGGDETQT